MSDLRILHSTRPIDKFLLVQGLKLLGETVAVTGAKSSDIPLFKIADVAIGIEPNKIKPELYQVTDVANHYRLEDIGELYIKQRIFNEKIKQLIQFLMTFVIVLMVLEFTCSIILI